MLALLGLLRSPGQVVAGQALFDGVDLLILDEEAHRHLRGRRMAMIFQNPMTSLNPVLSIGHQIIEAIQADHDPRWPGSAARDRAIELLRLVGIPAGKQRLGSYPHELSGGMRQRVVIAIALARAPDLLVADEPTTALDVTIQAQILELLNDLRHQTGLSMIYITHDLHVAAQICDELIVMYAGQVLETGPAEQVLLAPTHPYTAALVDAIPAKHWQEERLRSIPGQPPQPSLGDVGCPFAPRCSYVEQRCKVEMPPWVTTAVKQRARCFRWV
jgi:peptide/nickel transport system ATP-binding protein